MRRRALGVVARGGVVLAAVVALGLAVLSEFRHVEWLSFPVSTARATSASGFDIAKGRMWIWGSHFDSAIAGLSAGAGLSLTMTLRR
jgi:hypothetical protein